MNFESIGLSVPKILLPKEGTDMTRWAVVACDQFTSQPEYWEEIKEFIGSAPSTLNIILPEVYLEEKTEERIEKINQNMNKYLQEGILVEQIPGFVLIDRKTSHAESRKGLVVALDLEKYNYEKGSQTLIRATEGTIIERLPPRIKIRENAPIELPHIMVLIDDPEKTVIEPLFSKKFKKLYDFNLMKNSGHIKGHIIENESDIKEIADAISRLAEKEIFEKKYSIQNKGTLLYAVGDGNHSLATAKAIWEKLKQQGASKDNPSRYALVELVNIHDNGLVFEPIHRIIFNTDAEKLLASMQTYFNSQDFEYKTFQSKQEYENALNSITKGHTIPFISGVRFGIVNIKNPKLNLEVGTLQSFLDEFIKQNPECKIDYVHGKEIVHELGSKQNNIGFLLPSMKKEQLFRTVILDGALPRKTFSMGEADEKRFYLECRKII